VPLENRRAEAAFVSLDDCQITYFSRLTLWLSNFCWAHREIEESDIQAAAFVRLTARSVGVLPKTGIVDAVPVSLSEEHRYEAGTPLWLTIAMAPCTTWRRAESY